MARADGRQAYDCPLDAFCEFVDIGCGVVIADDAEHKVVGVAHDRDASPQLQNQGWNRQQSDDFSPHDAQALASRSPEIERLGAQDLPEPRNRHDAFGQPNRQRVSKSGIDPARTDTAPIARLTWRSETSAWRNPASSIVNRSISPLSAVDKRRG